MEQSAQIKSEAITHFKEAIEHIRSQGNPEAQFWKHMAKQALNACNRPSFLFNKSTGKIIAANKAMVKTLGYPNILLRKYPIDSIVKSMSKDMKTVQFITNEKKVVKTTLEEVTCTSSYLPYIRLYKVNM